MSVDIRFVTNRTGLDAYIVIFRAGDSDRLWDGGQFVTFASDPNGDGIDMSEDDNRDGSYRANVSIPDGIYDYEVWNKTGTANDRSIDELLDSSFFIVDDGEELTLDDIDASSGGGGGGSASTGLNVKRELVSLSNQIKSLRSEL